MFSLDMEPREGFLDKAHSLGFVCADDYWAEDHAYCFSMEEVEIIEAETERVHKLCLEAVKFMLDDDSLLHRLKIPTEYWSWLRKSFPSQSLYGRFDFRFDGKGVKLYEYNADTPTSIWEASVFQWLWMEDVFPKGEVDQFNSIEDKLTATFQKIGGPIHFAVLKDNPEDSATVGYIRDRAAASGMQTFLIDVNEIGLGSDNRMYGMQEERIHTLFKLYPWEWMIAEDKKAKGQLPFQQVMWLEPPWKLLLSSKALLPVLWKMFPGDKALLPAFFEERPDCVRKPIFSREGANITLDGNSTPGPYGEEGYIWQQKCLLPEIEKRYPVIGSWIIGDQAAGMGIRESKTPITDNTSNFVPHFIRE